MVFFKKFIFRCIPFFIIVILLVSFHFVTDGFKLNKIIPSHKLLEEDLCSIDNGVLNILDQKYYYLGKGRQSFVFESEDGNYVLKLIRYHRISPSFLAKIPFLYSFVGSKEIKHLDQRYLLMMESFNIAEKYLKEQTALVYLHLKNDRSIPKKTIFVDRLNRTIDLNLNYFGFVIQKKGEILGPKFVNLQKIKDLKMVQKIIDSYLDTISFRISMGITNKDHNWETNYGICNGIIKEIDIGRLCFLKEKMSQSLFHAELVSCSRFFKEHVKRSFPELDLYFDQKLLNKCDIYAKKECL